jgi:uncharacterized SAM-binding protein YcdF (DUF218 family)
LARASWLKRETWGVWLAALALLAATGVLARTMFAIEHQSSVDETRPADLIVVMGAAQYAGRPSPILKARLDHALELWHRNMAAHLLTTGGAGGDLHYTEGGVGQAYLVKHGVPPEAIVVETSATTTAQSAAAIHEIMMRMDLHSCIVVSDGYHIYRTKRMLARRGIEVYGSPRPDRAQAGSVQKWWLYARQGVGYLLWTAGVAI